LPVRIDQRGSEVLERNECLRLLAVGAGGIGRVGFVDSEGVVIEPVNYRMLEHDVMVQVGEGSILDAARQQAIVGFEIDEVDTAGGHAWSVLVRGLATVLDGEDQPENARPLAGEPLIPESGESFVRIRTGILSGRRFPLRPSSASV
jgi:nitroimidazol reductase NimA-like FMN-containing flavoprotein (pyridoxamine 5'-phosphate oxidase superfamily)